jgi:hypothetical protein
MLDLQTTNNAESKNCRMTILLEPSAKLKKQLAAVKRALAETSEGVNASGTVESIEDVLRTLSVRWSSDDLVLERFKKDHLAIFTAYEANPAIVASTPYLTIIAGVWWVSTYGAKPITKDPQGYRQFVEGLRRQRSLCPYLGVTDDTLAGHMEAHERMTSILQRGISSAGDEPLLFYPQPFPHTLLEELRCAEALGRADEWLDVSRKLMYAGIKITNELEGRMAQLASASRMLLRMRFLEIVAGVEMIEDPLRREFIEFCAYTRDHMTEIRRITNRLNRVFSWFQRGIYPEWLAVLSWYEEHARDAAVGDKDWKELCTLLRKLVDNYVFQGPSLNYWSVFDALWIHGLLSVKFGRGDREALKPFSHFHPDAKPENRLKQLGLPTPEEAAAMLDEFQTHENGLRKYPPE